MPCPLLQRFQPTTVSSVTLEPNTLVVDYVTCLTPSRERCRNRQQTEGGCQRCTGGAPLVMSRLQGVIHDLYCCDCGRPSTVDLWVTLRLTCGLCHTAKAVWLVEHGLAAFVLPGPPACISLTILHLIVTHTAAGYTLCRWSKSCSRTKKNGPVFAGTQLHTITSANLVEGHSGSVRELCYTSAAQTMAE